MLALNFKMDSSLKLVLGATIGNGVGVGVGVAGYAESESRYIPGTI